MQNPRWLANKSAFPTLPTHQTYENDNVPQKDWFFLSQIWHQDVKAMKNISSVECCLFRAAV